jgi:hypothetical protein
MNWIFEIKAVVESIFLKFESFENGKAEMTSIKLIKYFEDESDKGRIIDNKLEIPDEIWN